MSNPIVIVNVSQSIAPSPNMLQETGALISQGGTILGTGAYSLLTGKDDLDDLLPAALAVTSITWSSAYGGQATATTTVAHGVPVNQQFITTIAGAVQSGYNGMVKAIATGASTFTYYVANPGATPATGTLTYTRNGVGELQAMVETFFNQQGSQLVYVLELGQVAVATAVGNLSDFINASPQFFYSYLTPRAWDGNATFLTFLAGFEATTSKTYFFVTTNLQNMDLYTVLMKDVVAMVEAPVYAAWPAVAVSTASWTGGVATTTTAAAHGVAPGMTFTILDVVPAGFNGTYVALSGTTGSSLLYSVAVDPTAFSSAGTLVQSRYASAGVPAAEFSHASDFFVTLNYDPSTTNKVTPFAFSFLYGVTPFPIQGNSALIETLNETSVNYVGTGAEGGITDTIIFNGHNMDGRPFNYWYSVDWMAINIKQSLANAVINGSNNPINPLYYNQDGINRLQQAAASTAGSAVTFGLALGKVLQVGLSGPVFSQNLNAGTYAGNVVINAVPFTVYLTDNPSDYRTGTYNGLSITYPPQRGFESITVDINVTDFVA